MTPGSPNMTDAGHFAGIVADIARTLESPHEAEVRIVHVLGLVRQLVPCDRAALCMNPPDGNKTLLVVPEQSDTERARLAEFLGDILRFMEGAEDRRSAFDSRIHLALPVIGLDEILGVLLVEREHGTEYEAHHLRLLAAICSLLGAYLTMIGLHQDIVRQTTLLLDREQQLRGAARFREEFIGVIGHDLRNPLSAIRTGTRLLMKRARLEPPDAAVLERVESSVERMSRMIDELTDFARGRLGGGIPLRRRVVDLHALCREVVDEARAAHDRLIELRASGNPHGHWDSDRLAQLLSNLVGNALQHSPAKTPVTVTVGDDQEYAMIDVTNTGTPIPPEQVPHIFEPFRRGDKTTSAGLGLGLYIVERIVHAHGGTIHVTSTEERTTFTVRLPRRRATDRDGLDRSR